MPVYLDQKITEKHVAGKYAEKVPQRQFMRTWDYMQQQMDYLTPNTDYFPDSMNNKKRQCYARTALEKASARNGTAFWTMGASRRYVESGNTFSLFWKESTWLTAVREQMGIGIEGILEHTTTIGQTCNCTQHRPPIDHQTDQHFHGCPYGRGERTRAHTKIQGAVRGLARAARMINRQTDITAPTSSEHRYMDIPIQDPDTGVTMHIDIRRSNSLAKSYQTTCGVAAVSGRPYMFRQATTTKATTYAVESERLNALLTPFCVDSNGSFCPRDTNHAPAGLDPNKIINLLFKNGQTGSQRGKIPTSVEEGILRMLANRAADPERGCGAFDVSLPVKRVAARFKQEAELQIAYHALKGSAQARLRAMRRCNESY
jgi:hypothetical protein